MANKGYIYRGAETSLLAMVIWKSLWLAEINYHDLVSTSLYYANKVKRWQRYSRHWYLYRHDPTIIYHHSFSRKLLAQVLIVLVQPTGGEARKFASCFRIVEQFVWEGGWSDVQTALPWGEVNRHPWDIAVDEFVILGDHVTTGSNFGIDPYSLVFGEDDYNVGVANGLDCVRKLLTNGIMMANAGAEEFEGQFYDKLCQHWKTRIFFLLRRSLSSLPDWRTEKTSIWRAVPQWFASVSKFRQEILDEIEKWSSLSEWGGDPSLQYDSWRGDWVTSFSYVLGVCLFQSSMQKTEHQSLTAETIEHVAQLFERTWFHHLNWTWCQKPLAWKVLPIPGSPNGEFKKETNIMDVWFDSGSWNELSWLTVRTQISNF